MQPQSRTDPLRSLPNIGADAAKWLRAAGVTTPDDLRRLGSIEAAVRILALRPTDGPCRSMLAALEGAIRGCRWHTIPKSEREALWQQYQARTNRPDKRTIR